MNQIFSIVILPITFLFVSGTLKSQDQNISGIYLQSASKSIEIKPKNSVQLVFFEQVNDSTMSLVHKTGHIISFSDSTIVLRKFVQMEVTIVNNVRGKRAVWHYYDIRQDEKLNLKDVIGVSHNSKSIFHFEKYYSTNDTFADKAHCDCKRRKNDTLYGYELVKVD